MKSAVRLNPASPLLFMTLVYFTFSARVRKVSRSSRRRMVAIRGLTQQRVKRPFLASPAALGMWQLVGVRSIATLKAALTPLSAQERSF